MKKEERKEFLGKEVCVRGEGCVDSMVSRDVM
jgi:hypothetical protein